MHTTLSAHLPHFCYIIGGFFVHNEDKGYVSYHVPGFKYKDGFNHQEESDVIKLLRKYAYKIDGINSVPRLPIPDPPALFFNENDELSWVGSAWADQYQIYSRKPGAWRWTVFAKWMSDDFEAEELSLPCDQEMEYRALAKNKDATSGYSAILSPKKSE